MQVISIDQNQIDYICAVFDNDRVREICSTNTWYRDFGTGIVYDIHRKRFITPNQLFQVRKISDLAGLRWSLII